MARPGSPTLDSSAANQWSQSYDAAADGTVGNSPSGAWMEVDLDYPSTSPTTSQGTYDPGDAGGMLSPYGDNAWVGGESWGGGQPGGAPVGSPTVPAIASPAPAPPAMHIDPPASSWDIALAYAEGFGQGLLQGTANAVNGLQNAAIGAVNGAIQFSEVGLLASAAGININIPQPEWSNNLFYQEPGNEHAISEFLGGQGALLVLTGGLSGAGEVAEGADAAQVSAAGSEGSSSAQIVRVIEKGEKIADLTDELKYLQLRRGEAAIVSLQDGTRLIVVGGRTGINFDTLPELARVIAHTHPFVTGPSEDDFDMLAKLGQKSSYILELGGTLFKFVRP